MQPQVFIIICTHKITDTFEEISGAFVNRKAAREAKENLDKNFPDYKHTIKVLPLQNVANDTMNHRCFIFAKHENM